MKRFFCLLLCAYLLIGNMPSAAFAAGSDTDSEQNLICGKKQHEPPEDAGLIAFSTCTYDFANARFVLLGALEEIESAAK